jgi:hypothetical protein
MGGSCTEKLSPEILVKLVGEDESLIWKRILVLLMREENLIGRTEATL